jgi:hypothetical protein
MASEWRVSVSLPKRSRAKEEDSRWTTAMSTVRSGIGSDIRVSQAPGAVFLYATSADAAMQAEHVVRDVMAEHDVSAGVRCDQWNPIKQSWTSREDVMNAEREKSAATGRAMWQVRVAPLFPLELKALTKRLES